MKVSAPLAVISVLSAAVSASAQSAPPTVLARPFYCFSTGRMVPAGTPSSQLATVCPASTGQSGTTCSYSYTCRSAQCAQLMGGWSRTLSETGPNVTFERCEEARMRTIPTASTQCDCKSNGSAVAAGTTTTGSLAGDALNLGANLWIARNIKNPYTAKFAQSFSQSFLTSFFSSYAEAQRQRQLMNETLLKQQQEAAAKARLAEKQRIDALFARLNSELKLSGSTTNLALKTGGGSGELPLKLESTGDGGQALRLKLGNENGNVQGAGINGLPGIYVGGPGNPGTNPDTDGLKLKVGDGATATSAAAADPAPSATSGGMGIPGLPGIYLNDVPPQRAADLADAATNLSGPERQIAEDAALTAAQKNPALTGPSDDPFVVDYQNEAKTYAEAILAQQQALQKATEAEGHAQASRSVVEYLGGQVDPAAQTEAQKQAFQQINLSADSDEALAAEARRTFEQTDIRLSIARDRASDALAGLASPPVATAAALNSTVPPLPSSRLTLPATGSSSVVDLREAKPQVTPAILTTPPAGGPIIASPLELCVADATNKVAGNMRVPTESELNLQLEQAKAGYLRLMETEEHALEDRSEWVTEMKKAVADATMGFTDKGLEFLIGPDSRILSNWQVGIRDEVVTTRAQIREAEAALAAETDAARRTNLHDRIYELMMRRELLRDGVAAIRNAKTFYAGYADAATLRDAALWMTDWGKYPFTAPFEKSKNLDVTKIIPGDKMGLDAAIGAALNSGDLEAFMDGVKQLLKITMNQPGVKTWMKGASKALGLGTGIAEWYSMLSLAVDTSYDLAVIGVGIWRLDKISKNDARLDQAKATMVQRIKRVQAALDCYGQAQPSQLSH